MTDKKEKDVRKITTPRFRGSFVQVFEPKANLQGKLTYSIVMLYDKAIVKEGELKDLQRIVKEAAIEKFGSSVDLKSLITPFKNGDEKDYEGYKGCVTVQAASQYPPAVVDGQLQIIIDPNEVYSGAYYKASVTAYGWENMGRKGISIGLQNLQKIADGEAFSGRGNPEDDFEPIIPEEVDVAETEDLFNTGINGKTQENFGIEGL